MKQSRGIGGMEPTPETVKGSWSARRGAEREWTKPMTNMTPLRAFFASTASTFVVLVLGYQTLWA